MATTCSFRLSSTFFLILTHFSTFGLNIKTLTIVSRQLTSKSCLMSCEHLPVGSDMSEAQIRVFSTPELLEAILDQLPPRELLQAQRISRSFQSVIKTSPTLQQALYLRPALAKTSGEWSINPLLRDLFLPWLVIAENRWGMPSYDALGLLDWVTDSRRKKAMLHADATWRRMFLIQPPPTTLKIVQFCHSQGGDFISDGDVSFDDEEQDGVTMGALYDIPLSFLRYEKVSSFSLQIHSQENAAPEMALHLTYTSQCCRGYLERGQDLSSQAKHTWDFHRIKMRGRQQENASHRRRFLQNKAELLSDLTAERGGIPSYEFEKWLRERAPVSSLISDVR